MSPDSKAQKAGCVVGNHFDDGVLNIQLASGRGIVASEGGTFASFPPVSAGIQAYGTKITDRPALFFVKESVVFASPARIESSERA